MPEIPKIIELRMKVDEKKIELQSLTLELMKEEFAENKKVLDEQMKPKPTIYKVPPGMNPGVN